MTMQQTEAERLAAEAAAKNTGPTLDEILAMDEVPAEHANIAAADLKAWLAEHDGKVASTVTSQISDTLAERERQRRENEQAQATAQDDIDYATGLQARTLSNDDAVRVAAQAELADNRQRYERGLAIKYQQSTAEQQNKALVAHYLPRMEALKAGGHQALLDMLTPEKIGEYGNNEFLAAIAYGEARGYARGKAEGIDETERAGRVAEGAQGAQRNGGGSGNGGAAPKIDLSKPGAGRAILRGS